MGKRPPQNPIMPAPAFPGVGAPSTDFQAVRDRRRSVPFYYDVDLSTARSIAAGTHLTLPVAGNSFYSDQNPNQGAATVVFQDTNLNPRGTPLYVGPGWIGSVPFTQLLIEHAAQAGKIFRFVYGVDIDFKPSLSGSLSIGGAISATPYGFTFGASYKSTTALAANTPETVFTPAANVNGAVLWAADFVTVNAGGAGVAAGFVAKTSAPATPIDGDVILGGQTFFLGAAPQATTGTLQRPVLIPAGRGLYFISTPAETTAYRGALYTLL
jgi:hypothetical protein